MRVCFIAPPPSPPLTHPTRTPAPSLALGRCFRCSKAFATKDKLRRHALSHARRKLGVSVSVGNAARREAELRQREALALSAAQQSSAAGVSSGGGTTLGHPLVCPLLATSQMERERAEVTNQGGGKRKLNGKNDRKLDGKTDGKGGGECDGQVGRRSDGKAHEKSDRRKKNEKSDGKGGDGSSSSGRAYAGGWKHTCPNCGRNFLDNYHLKRHIKAIHEGPRPYTCDHPMPPPASTSSPAIAAAATAAATSSVTAATASAAAPTPTPAPVVAFLGRAGEAAIGAAVGAAVGVGGVCGAAFAKKWQLREHFLSEHGQTK